MRKQGKIQSLGGRVGARFDLHRSDRTPTIRQIQVLKHLVPEVAAEFDSLYQLYLLENPSLAQVGHEAPTDLIEDGLELLSGRNQVLFAYDCALRVLPWYEATAPQDVAARRVVQELHSFAYGTTDAETITEARVPILRTLAEMGERRRQATERGREEGLPLLFNTAQYALRTIEVASNVVAPGTPWVAASQAAAQEVSASEYRAIALAGFRTLAKHIFNLDGISESAADETLDLQIERVCSYLRKEYGLRGVR